MQGSYDYRLNAATSDSGYASLTRMTIAILSYTEFIVILACPESNHDYLSFWSEAIESTQ